MKTETQTLGDVCEQLTEAVRHLRSIAFLAPSTEQIDAAISDVQTLFAVMLSAFGPYRDQVHVQTAAVRSVIPAFEAAGVVIDEDREHSMRMMLTRPVQSVVS